MKPAVLYVGEDHCVAAFGPILAMVVRTDPGSNILEDQKHWIRHLRSHAPDGCAFITVLSSDTPPPSEEARAFIKQVFRTFGEVVQSGAMVIEGKGFVAATLRSILSMILMALRPSYPFKIFAQLDDCLAWTLEHLDNPKVTRQELLIEFERLKASYKAQTLVVTV